VTYLVARDYDLIRSDPSSVIDLWNTHRNDFVVRAGLVDAPEGVSIAAFCSVLAYDFAPYGVTPEHAYADLLKTAFLDCAKYVRLTMGLVEEFGRSDITFHAVGWDYGNSVPNHSQLFAKAGGESVFLDPMIGLIVRDATLSGVVSGTRYGGDHMVSFYDWNRSGGANLDSQNVAIQHAIANGTYEQRYAIYDAPTAEDFRFAGANAPLTPSPYWGMIIGNRRSGSHFDDAFTWSGTAWGGRGNDNILGLSAKDQISGGDGNDRLSGGAGDDRLAGEAGNDLLRGGPGRDVMSGGLGRDIFVLGEGDTGYGGMADTITDFRRGDKLDFRLIDADQMRVGNQSFKWIGRSGFTGDVGELRFRNAGADIIVEGDMNGDQRADLHVTLTYLRAVAAQDFVL
jgi:hypothetical protein